MSAQDAYLGIGLVLPRGAIARFQQASNRMLRQRHLTALSPSTLSRVHPLGEIEDARRVRIALGLCAPASVCVRVMFLLEGKWYRVCGPTWSPRPFRRAAVVAAADLPLYPSNVRRRARAPNQRARITRARQPSSVVGSDVTGAHRSGPTTTLHPLIISLTFSTTGDFNPTVINFFAKKQF